MAYRVTITAKTELLTSLRHARDGVDSLFGGLVRDGADLLQKQAVQNLSGVPFTSKTGTHTIQKRTGRTAAGVQYQHPYGSPFQARIFTSNMTRYADNPEEWDIAAILEYGRGEIKPKYTPSAKGGNPGRASLVIPGGPHALATGQKGFRGISGRYRFVRSIPPMAGKFWMEAAAETVMPQIQQMADHRIDEFLRERGL